MDWKISNALNRDVERQQLNKILLEIRAAITTLTELRDKQSSAPGTPPIMSGGVSSNYNPSTGVTEVTPNAYVLSLRGDVSGEARVGGSGTVTLTTELDPALIGVPEAPVDNQIYWRTNESWTVVPDAILSIADIQEQGLMALVEDPVTFALEWTAREIEGATEQIDVANGDGITGNPILSLADVPDIGGGELQKSQFDIKGRKIGTSSATTDDLVEGIDNLYFTDARVLEAISNTVPPLPNADSVDIIAGMAISRIAGGYVRADCTLSDRWNAVGIYEGELPVPPAETLRPRVDGILTLTTGQWDTVLGTIGGLATGMNYFVGNSGIISVNPPVTVGEYVVAIGLAITATDLHIRDTRPVQL